jgi:hypothetical protein
MLKGVYRCGTICFTSLQLKGGSPVLSLHPVMQEHMQCSVLRMETRPGIVSEL